jgi:hypothetical protein
MGFLSFQELLESEWSRKDFPIFQTNITVSFKWYYHWSRTYRNPIQRARRCAEKIAGDIERRRWIIQRGEVAVNASQFFDIPLGMAPWVDLVIEEGIHGSDTATTGTH